MSRSESMTEDYSQKLYRYDNVLMDRIPSMNDIKDEDIRKYRNQGYLVIEKAFTEEEIGNAAEAIMDIIHGKVNGPFIQFVSTADKLKTEMDRELACRKVMDYVEHDSRLHHMTFHPDVMRVTAQICGEPVKNIHNTALLKPPHGGIEKPWHQDMAYGSLTYHKPSVATWVALDDADLDNGCMHIIPGSHRFGATPHYSIRDWQLCDSHVPVEDDVVVPLKAGGMIIFHGLLYHGTPSNHSSKRRRALQNHYVAQSAVKMKPKEYKQWFTQEMTGVEC